MRIHHFLHEQLLTEFHDVKIVSLLLRRSDQGLSLFEIISQIRISDLANYDLLLHIEQKIKNYSTDELKLLIYDEALLFNQIKIFDAKAIPHFNEKQPDGVFNAEYDSDLTNVDGISENNFIAWVEE